MRCEVSYAGRARRETLQVPEMRDSPQNSKAGHTLAGSRTRREQGSGTASFLAKIGNRHLLGIAQSSEDCVAFKICPKLEAWVGTRRALHSARYHDSTGHRLPRLLAGIRRFELEEHIHSGGGLLLATLLRGFLQENQLLDF